VVVNSFGSGKALWLAASLESVDEAVNRKLLASLLGRVLPGPFRFEVDGHPMLEMTLFDQPELGRLRASLLNLQRHWPQLPAGARVRIRVPDGRKATAVRRAPDLGAVPFRMSGPYAQFDVEPFESFAMFLVEYA
jgi:hypothetical protein